MIINALAKAYDSLSKNEDVEITRDGFSYEKVPFIAVIDTNGKLIDLISNTKTVIINGKNKEEIKKERLPERISPRTSVVPNFLCDSFSYVFGLEIVDETDESGKKTKALKQTDKSRKSFETFKKRIQSDLKDVPGDCANAIIKFYEQWNPEREVSNDLFYYKDKDGNGKLKELNGNIIFALNSVDCKSIDDVNILKRWDTLRQKDSGAESGDTVIAQCCISGDKAVIARTHISIKGVKNAQSSGAAIVTYNSPAFESFNKTQSYNGPISEGVMKKYTAALNYFLRSGSKNKLIIGNDTLVFWAECDNEDYADDFNDLLGFNIKPTESEEDATESKVMSALKQIKNGQLPSAFNTDDSTQFHILILSPNAARISVRRYYNTTFGKLRDNVLRHYMDMALYDSKGEFKQIPLWQILDATVSSAITKDRANSINPNFSGALFESVLNGYQYPPALFAEMIMRIKTDNASSDDKQKTARLIGLTNIRTAFIKAYIVRKDRKNNKEEIAVDLNKDIRNEGYLLGRLFAVMEKAQQDAIPGANSTIKDRFFASACGTPATVFPTLIMGYQNHIAKLEGKGIRYEILADEIMGKLGDHFPKQLDLDGQGRFILGYYQQRADLWKKLGNNIQNQNIEEGK